MQRSLTTETYPYFLAVKLPNRISQRPLFADQAEKLLSYSSSDLPQLTIRT